eukprot:PLAT2927.1.p2 GENE.PLAT2927.1~~PLAT2927.1.p2  ORF type:complete len:1002 (+),score=576.26 PLAT2927.1:76-3006(+)
MSEEFAMEEEKTVECLTSKEIKALARPEFAASPEKFYPTETFAKFGYSRTQCPKCGNNFWRYNETVEVCGDCNCVGKYTFIGKGTGKGRVEGAKKMTYADAWKSYKESMESARIPMTAIDRYPVVARWRADVDYVAAGIFCFQPYCVTGELAPPANPLICPQFCLRFNDLDNIGLTGRHYSGFIMLGMQVFNTPEKYVFFKEECVEFNLRWLIDGLGIDPAEITLIEDVWAGGGNLGPSVEYFIGGLELGNMVFMQYKTFPDGAREELQVQVIDVGIGLERIPWLINGSPTSYCDVFPRALELLTSRLGMELTNEVWEKFGPYSSKLNIDEVEDLDATWAWIAEQIGMEVDAVRTAIEPVRDLYIVADHTRTVLMAVTDGSLPSNVGGASNVRNVLRRVFAMLAKNGWWDVLGMDGLMELFEAHKLDLAEIYGPFAEYKSFRPIIEIEYERWCNTDALARDKLKRVMKKSGGTLTLADWILCVRSFGLPVDRIAEVSGQKPPETLYYEIALLQERTARAVPTVLYSTAHLPATDNIYFDDHHCYEFEAEVITVIGNVTEGGRPNIVVLNRSAFYPTSGGQAHDTGALIFRGKEYAVVDVEKVGGAIFHYTDEDLPEDAVGDAAAGEECMGVVDRDRRDQLRTHHTATHIMFASARRVLGPHVWQHGAKKTTKEAHLDITHYRSVSHEELMAIEAEANRIIRGGHTIHKSWRPKEEAEAEHGFVLYQGGVVPGNKLRVVQIEDTDVEACCGTHCDSTSEVGSIRLLKVHRISDGIVRMHYVAGERALERHISEATLLHDICSSWSVTQDELLATSERFFDGYKRFKDQAAKQAISIAQLQVRLALADAATPSFVVRSSAPDATLYIGQLPLQAAAFKEAGKSMFFVGDTFLYGLCGVADAVALEPLKELLAASGADGGKAAKVISKNKVTFKPVGPGGKKSKKKVTVKDIVEVTAFNVCKTDDIMAFLTDAGFILLE